MTSLYRHFDAAGTLLYVGIADCPGRRLAAHYQTSHWARDIATISVEWFDTREDAEAAEVAAIHKERPLHNKMHGVPDGIRGEVVAFTNALGCEAIQERLGLTHHSIRNARDRGALPARWFVVLRHMAEEAGIECPLHLFKWKGRTA